MSKRKKKYLYTTILPIIILCSLFLQKHVERYLSLNSAVQSDTLVVEGWLPKNYYPEISKIIEANSINRIYTTGQDAPDFYPVVMNGYLAFYFNNLFQKYPHLEINSVKLIARSSMDNEHSANVDIYNNDSLVQNLRIDSELKPYPLNCRYISQGDSILVWFTNDSMGVFGDHNLYIKELLINDSIRYSYKNNSVYQRLAKGWEWRYDNNYHTWAGLARNRLIDQGIPINSVTAIPTGSVKINRTYNSAESLYKYLNKNENNYSFNIISRGIHSRRTLLSYRKVFGKNSHIGIYSIEITEKDKYLNRYFSTYKEVALLFYYSLL